MNGNSPSAWMASFSVNGLHNCNRIRDLDKKINSGILYCNFWILWYNKQKYVKPKGWLIN